MVYMTVRAVLADDSALIRGGIARVLQDKGVEVMVEVEDATALLRAVGEHRPDLAIVDIRMPPSYTVEGIEAAITIRAQHPGTAVLLLSQYVETAAAMRLLAGGASGVGYLLKERVSDIDEFIAAVHTVVAGGTVMDSDLVTRMMERPHRGRRGLDDLTKREREVLSLMAEGKSNQAIRAQLFLTLRTVEAHISAIFTKLGLHPESDDHRRVLAVLTYLKAIGP
jgi:DNA-binding NarL/FixJ family response regulator